MRAVVRPATCVHSGHLSPVRSTSLRRQVSHTGGWWPEGTQVNQTNVASFAPARWRALVSRAIPECNGAMTSSADLNTPALATSIRLADEAGIVVDESGCDVDDLVFCGAPEVRVPASESWGGIVDLAVQRGWVGIEALAALPGSIDDVTRRNGAAFGQSVSDVVSSVRTWDRVTDAQRTFAAVDCRFTDEGSALQERLDDGTERYAILDVRFLFKQGDLTSPIRDDALAARLGVDIGARAPLAGVRDAVRSA